MSTKPKLLILTDWFAPAYKAGGPVQSCINLAQFLTDDFLIFILTSDRDLGDDQPFEIETGKWLEWQQGIQVQYLSPQERTIKSIGEIIKILCPHYIYLNSMFSLSFTIYPLVLRWQKKINSSFILAPRGMLRQSAIKIKKPKKQTFLFLGKLTGLFKGITFHATDRKELSEIRNFFHLSNPAILVPNVPRSPLSSIHKIEKMTGHLNCICVGRIHPIKNIQFLIECLRAVKAKLTLTIIGPKEDPVYWNRCLGTIKELPQNIVVTYVGEKPPSTIQFQLQDHHLFVLPTLGENFGHAIFEAFACGRPVLISDQTPWRGLEAQKAGWDIPLEQPKNWIRTIEEVAAMNQEELNAFYEGAWQFAKDFIDNSDLQSKYLALFS